MSCWGLGGWGIAADAYDKINATIAHDNNQIDETAADKEDNCKKERKVRSSQWMENHIDTLFIEMLASITPT